MTIILCDYEVLFPQGADIVSPLQEDFYVAHEGRATGFEQVATEIGAKAEFSLEFDTRSERDKFFAKVNERATPFLNFFLEQAGELIDAPTITFEAQASLQFVMGMMTDLRLLTEEFPNSEFLANCLNETIPDVPEVRSFFAWTGKGLPRPDQDGLA